MCHQAPSFDDDDDWDWNIHSYFYKPSISYDIKDINTCKEGENIYFRFYEWNLKELFQTVAIDQSTKI